MSSVELSSVVFMFVVPRMQVALATMKCGAQLINTMNDVHQFGLIDHDSLLISRSLSLDFLLLNRCEPHVLLADDDTFSLSSAKVKWGLPFLVRESSCPHYGAAATGGDETECSVLICFLMSK